MHQNGGHEARVVCRALRPQFDEWSQRCDEKLKSQASCSIPLVELCASQICELYSMCYTNNFEFLKMTICRDSVFLQNYLTLINDVLSLECPEYMVIPLLKMFLIFCTDSNSNSFLIEQIKNKPSLFMDFFLFGLHVKLINSPFQRFTLSALSLVFTKAQLAAYDISMLSELEKFELAFSDPDIAKDGKQELSQKRSNLYRNASTMNPRIIRMTISKGQTMRSRPLMRLL